jgi:adenylosuccinate synthase
MMYVDNLGHDLTWAIGRQCDGELTRVDVLGIIKTHKVCSEYRVNGKLYGYFTKDGKLTNSIR